MENNKEVSEKKQCDIHVVGCSFLDELIEKHKANKTTHPEYNDWWVEREKLNAL